MTTNTGVQARSGPTFGPRAQLVAGAVVIFALFGLAHQASQPHFTVAPGDNLVDKMGYDRAINFAEDVGLPIYAKIGSGETKIVPGVARAIEPATDAIRVRVPIYPGDQVDTRFGRARFTPAPGHPIEDR